MPEFCSCGAQLPPDARFCHKCGKPQRAEILVEEEPEPTAIQEARLPPPSAPTPAALNFRNPVAVRVGLEVGPKNVVRTGSRCG